MTRDPRPGRTLRDPRLWRFLLVGAANTAASYALYALGLRLGLGYPLASLAALIGGIVMGFAAHGRITFRSRLAGRFGRFVAVWAVIYAVYVALIWALTGTGLSAYLAGLVALPVTTALSFVLQSRHVFGTAA